MQPLRVALLGYGLAGRVFHAPLIAATPGLELAVVVTADPARREQVARDHPGTRLAERPAQVWSAAGDLDVAVVATPNASHAPLAEAALDAGLDVVVDKPLAPDPTSAAALVARAAAAQRLLTVFHNRRWDGDLLTVRRLLADGALGEVSRFESRFERWRPEPKAGSWRERSSAAEGGGLLLDLGSHLVDQALFLFGPVDSVYAELARRRPGVSAEDDAFLTLHHVDGVVSHLWVSAVAGQVGPRFRVLGDQGSYVKWGLDIQEEQLGSGTRPDDPAYGIEPAQRWGRLGTDAAGQPVATERGDYPAFYRELVDAVRRGGPVPVQPQEAVAGLLVLEAARTSAAERRVVSWPGGWPSPGDTT